MITVCFHFLVPGEPRPSVAAGLDQGVPEWAPLLLDRGNLAVPYGKLGVAFGVHFGRSLLPSPPAPYAFPVSGARMALKSFCTECSPARSLVRGSMNQAQDGTCEFVNG